MRLWWKVSSIQHHLVNRSGERVHHSFGGEDFVRSRNWGRAPTALFCLKGNRSAYQDSKEKMGNVNLSCLGEAERKPEKADGAGSINERNLRPRAVSYDEHGVHVKLVVSTTKGAKIKVAIGSVVAFEGDCIVNAANSEGIGGGGVDGAVNRAGGQKLIEARTKLPFVTPGVRIPEGQSRVTKAFGALKCQHLIHAVSANFNITSKKEGQAIVRSAYKSALENAEKLNCKTIAFSLLSAGIYRGDQRLEDVLRLGVESVKECAVEGQEVYFVAFLDEEAETLMELCKDNSGKNEPPNDDVKLSAM